MQMNKYLETYHIKDIRNYCQCRCIKIVNEDLNNKELLPYFRGKYKGYIYMIKVCNNILKQNTNLKRHELYNHLKEQKKTAMYNCKIRGGFSTGLTECFYDLMNYISINEM